MLSLMVCFDTVEKKRPKNLVFVQPAGKQQDIVFTMSIQCMCAHPSVRICPEQILNIHVRICDQFGQSLFLMSTSASFILVIQHPRSGRLNNLSLDNLGVLSHILMVKGIAVIKQSWRQELLKNIV